MSRETRVRYGRTSTKAPKNTLVTLRQGDTVYFGVARCNTVAGDAFKRDRGTLIATNRARAAVTDIPSTNVAGGGLKNLHQSCLRGSVPITEVKKLLEYFRNVDTYMYELSVSGELKAG